MKQGDERETSEVALQIARLIDKAYESMGLDDDNILEDLRSGHSIKVGCDRNFYLIASGTTPRGNIWVSSDNNDGGIDVLFFDEQCIAVLESTIADHHARQAAATKAEGEDRPSGRVG